MSFHSFRGQRSAAAAEQKSSGFSQASFRTRTTCHDQYGRRYVFASEKSTGMPCGLIEPTFWAPWMPDYHQSYWIVNPDNTSELYLDLEQFVKDRIVAMKEYHQRAVLLCEKKNWPAPKLGEYPEEITDMEKPPRAYQLAVAAIQGNPWVLGKTRRPDPRLEKYLELPSREIDETISNYDYSESSYQAAIRGKVADERQSQRANQGKRRFKSMAELAQARNAARDVDIDDPDSVAQFVGAEDTGAGLTEEEALAEFERENADATSAFDSLGADAEAEETEVEDDAGEETEATPETVPTDSEGAEARASDDFDDDLLVDDDDVDREAFGGRRVKPQNMERAQRQAPKRAFQRGGEKGKRKSVKDGARPAVSDG